MAFWKNVVKLFADEPATVKKPPVMGEVAAVDAGEALFGPRNKAFVRYNPSVLITNKGFTTIDKMRRDDQVKAAMTFKKNTVLASGWEVTSPEGKPNDWEVTEFVKTNLERMQGTFERKLLDILTAMEYGFSVSEKVWQSKDNMIHLGSIKTKKPHDMNFSTDTFGNLDSLEQMTVKLPVEKFVIYSYEMEFGNWYGTPDLEAAYRPWWTKDNSYKWLAILLERMGIPPIFALYDPSYYQNSNLTALQTVLQNMQAATVGHIPMTQSKDSGKSLEFWTPELAKNVADVFIPSLDMFNKDIARAILMPGLLGMTPDDNVGSNARSEVHFDVFMLVIERIRKELQEHIMQEQIVRELVDYNFIVDEYPQFTFLPLTDDVRLETFETWRVLSESGVVKGQAEDEIHIRKSLKFPERDIDENESYEPESEDDDIPPIEPDEEPQQVEFTARQPNQYEKKVDFTRIEKSLSSLEEQTVGAIKTQIQVAQDRLLKQIEKQTKPSIEWAKTTTVKINRLDGLINEHLRTAMEQGRVDIRSNIKNYDFPGLLPSAALSYLKEKGRLITGVIAGTLQTSARNVLLDSIKSGWTSGETMQKMREVFQPYVGDETVLRDNEVVKPHRLETIIRTNTTTAFNQGRLVEIRQSRDFIKGVMYSAIIDNRTTEVCNTLDGQIFRLDDPDLDKLTAPNHYNCRSILVPILIDEDVQEGDYITASKKGKAFDQSGKGFS